MTDTPREVEQLYRNMLMRRSGAERLRMGCAMFETAKALVRASLGDAAGVDNSPEMRARLFIRIYGQDFDAPTAGRIAAHLGRAGDKATTGTKVGTPPQS